MTARRERLLAWLVVAASAALLTLAFAWGSVPDEEEYRFSVLSTLLHARGLAIGRWAFWTSSLGFGMPHPLGQHFIWHPLMPLLVVMPVASWVTLLLVLHVAAGAVGMMWLGARLGLGPLPAAAATATFLLASPLQNYAVTDFWPSGVIGWTTMPWLLVAISVLLDPASPPHRCRRAAAGLGLGAGLALENVHPGYLLMYGLPMAAFVAPGLRILWARRWWWLMATGLMLTIASPMVVHLASELARFPPGIRRPNYDNPVGVEGVWDLFVKPALLGFGPGWPSVPGRAARGPFFGPFVLLACAAIVLPRWRDAGARGLHAAFLVSLVCLALPGLAWMLVVIPATSLFRDPMILFGALIAAIVVDRIWRARRAAAATLIALQLAALVVAGIPYLLRALTPLEPDRTSLFARERPMMTWLREHVANAEGRVLYSARVDQMVEAGELGRDGLWRNNPAYFGVRVVNGVFKGLSLDTLSPSELLPYGSVRTASLLQRSAATLALGGIRYVVAADREVVAPELRIVSRFTDHAGRQFALYDNPEVTGAAVVPLAALSVAMPALQGCAHDRMLCRDLGAVWAARDRTAAHVRGDFGELIVDLDTPARSASAVVVGEMYRPEWVATVGTRPVPTREVAQGLLGVEVPPGATRIDLHYRPAARRAASAAAGVAIAIACLVFVWSGRRRPVRDRSVV